MKKTKKDPGSFSLGDLMKEAKAKAKKAGVKTHRKWVFDNSRLMCATHTNDSNLHVHSLVALSAIKPINRNKKSKKQTKS